MVKNINKIPVITILLMLVALLPNRPLFAQKFVQDTLIVSLAELDSINPIPVTIDSVIDRREEHPSLIGRYEKNKYIFVPIDVLICTEKSLNEEITESLGVKSLEKSKVHLDLVIDEFSVTKKTNSRIYPHYLLNAAIDLYTKSDRGLSEYIGQLLYENTSRKPMFRDKLKNGFESVIKKWQRELNQDLEHISKDISLQHLSKLENFRSEVYTGKRTNLFSGIDFVIFHDGWISDYEVYFSHREAKKKFHRNGYNIRYRNADKYSSIEYGLTDDNMFNRRSDNWLFRVKSQMFFGVNKWKDIDSAEHKIYDALIFDVSMSQSLLFNPIDKKSFILGAGLVENLYYIYSKGFSFQLGLSIHLGIKL